METKKRILFAVILLVLIALLQVQDVSAKSPGGELAVNLQFKPEMPGPVTLSGTVGIGLWHTAIEVLEMAVNGKKLNASNWKVLAGTYRTKDGIYSQTDAGVAPAMSIGNEIFSDETVIYTLLALMTGRAEGFLIRFGADKNGR